MYFSTLVNFGLVGLAAAAPALFPEVTEADRALIRRQYPVMACSHQTGGIHVLAVGGANTDNPKDYGYLYSLAQSILAAVPGSTNVSVPYDKEFSSLNPPTLMPGAVAGGMTTLKSYIVEYHHACPHTKMALIGYSSGAVILSNDLCYGGNGVQSPQINPALAGNIIVAAITYGDETRVAGQSFHQGTCTSNSGTHPRANPGLCAPFANLMQSYCDVGDTDCCVGTGSVAGAHFAYPQKYDAVATQFVQSKLAAAGGP